MFDLSVSERFAVIESIFGCRINNMTNANKNGLVTIYGEDILNQLKGCEFPFKQSRGNLRGYSE